VKKIAVIYGTKYGATEKYARWIAEELDADLLEQPKTKLNSLLKYDIIIYGGGLYASGIKGVELMTKNYNEIKDKKIIVFTVGLADPNNKEQFRPIIDRNFNDEMKENITVFHFRGSINYKKLGVLHKAMMAMLKSMTVKKPQSELTDEDKQLLETYGEIVDFTDKAYILDLISYIQKYK
jgi:menaquinone-dependent protoporphyrinogen IX oxidase